MPGLISLAIRFDPMQSLGTLSAVDLAFALRDLIMDYLNFKVD